IGSRTWLTAAIGVALARTQRRAEVHGKRTAEIRHPSTVTSTAVSCGGGNRTRLPGTQRAEVVLLAGEGKCHRTPTTTTWRRRVAGQTARRSDGPSMKQSRCATWRSGRSGSTRRKRAAGQKRNRRHSGGRSKKPSARAKPAEAPRW